MECKEGSYEMLKHYSSFIQVIRLEARRNVKKQDRLTRVLMTTLRLDRVKMSQRVVENIFTEVSASILRGMNGEAGILHLFVCGSTTYSIISDIYQKSGGVGK